MSALTFADLRAANTTRHARYYTNGDDVWRHDDWLVALGGAVVRKFNATSAKLGFPERLAA
jgi:hypothetical protein